MLSTDSRMINQVKQSTLDIRYFLEAIEDRYKLYVVSSSEEREAYHFRAVSPAGSFAFMIFHHNIFLPLNSRISMFVTANKLTTYQWLLAYGIPTIPTYHLKSGATGDAENILKEGGSLVLKTTKGQGGAQVAMGVRSVKEIKDFLISHRGSSVIAQPEIKGNDYRLVFLKGELIAAVQRIPAFVTGDGHSTVSQLAAVLDDAFESLGRGRILQDKVLKNSSNNVTSKVPLLGERYYLTDKANFSLGGTAIDVTSDVPPLTIDIIKPLLRDLGAGLVGVDILTEDIATPLTKSGVVIELNAAPGMLSIAYAGDNTTTPDTQVYSTIINSIDLN